MDRENYNSRRKLWMASGLCLTFMIAELVGGIIANSLAILSDAAHLFSDLAGFLISLFALYMARRPATVDHSFGYHRAEILGALGSISLVWALTIYLVVEAIDRLRNPTEINGKVMFIVSCLGLLVNILYVTRFPCCVVF